MAKKKKRVVKSKSTENAKGKIFSRNKLMFVVRTLIIFVVLLSVSYILYYFFEGDVFHNFFYLLFIIFAGFALAFLLAFLVLLVFKWMKR